MARLIALAASFLAVTVLAETFPLPCEFIASEPEGVDREANCAVRQNGRIEVSQASLSKMFFSADGLARAFIDHSWYYIKRDGSTLPVITYDNGADYFSEGLVRSRIDGKIAYFDAQFKQLIPPKYDWAWPFEHGKAVVCIGCVEAPRNDSEHRRVVGGRWGYIDHHGHEIVSVTHSREEILKMERHP